MNEGAKEHRKLLLELLLQPRNAVSATDSNEVDIADAACTEVGRSHNMLCAEIARGEMVGAARGLAEERCATQRRTTTNKCRLTESVRCDSNATFITYAIF